MNAPDPAVPFELLLPAALLRQLVEHAQRELPAECCGLLAGVVQAGQGIVSQVLPLVNLLQAPDEFESEPRSLLAAHRHMRATGTDILAVYHSHPTSAPIPSRKDRERNYSESVVTLIVGCATEPPEVRCWWLTAATHREAAWRIGGDLPQASSTASE